MKSNLILNSVQNKLRSIQDICYLAVLEE